MFEITHLMLAVMFLMACVQLLINRAVKSLRSEHDRLSRVTLYALRDLEWKGIKETAGSIIADANESANNVVPFHRD